jgi:NADH dehydrogenase/NADH:ubiquinone oxidoreductase subunit G
MKSPDARDIETEITEAQIFVNQTGVMANPDLAAELIRGAKKTMPSSEGDREQVEANRADYLKEGLPIGSPPVIVLNDQQGEEELAADADRMSVLLDKLGERLAFERQGTRLYEAFILKLEQIPSEESAGPSSEDLRHICEEELDHFKLLQKAIIEIGGDATVETPSADIVGVLSHGIMQIVSDPRTTIPQTLQAILSAELADNDGWQMLKELAGQLGFSDLETKCDKAFEEEQEHLENVRGWLSEMTLSEAVGEERIPADNEPKTQRRAAKRPKRSAEPRSSKRTKKVRRKSTKKRR